MARQNSSFVVTDIETTGGRAGDDSIIEIAMVRLQEGRVTDTYCSFVNPGRPVPPWITSLTGITNADVASAPRWEQIQSEIRAFLGDSTFVAHNVGFDLSFIQQAFLRHGGGTYNPRKLCTARLARRMYPEWPSHSLAHVCNNLGIRLENHHRALDDTLASASILQHALQKSPQDVESQLKTTNKAWIPGSLEEEDFLRLPEVTGVYFLLNHKQKPLYIGKAKSIKSRVYQHFSDKDYAQKASRLQRETRSIQWIETPDEFSALLLEDHYIKHHRPVLNRAQNHTAQSWEVCCYVDQNHTWRLTTAKRGKHIKGVGPFGSEMAARQWMLEWLNKGAFNFNGLERMPRPEPQNAFLGAWKELMDDHSAEVNGWLNLGTDCNGMTHYVELVGIGAGQYVRTNGNGYHQSIRLAVDFRFVQSVRALAEEQALSLEGPSHQASGQMALF